MQRRVEAQGRREASRLPQARSAARSAARRAALRQWAMGAAHRCAHAQVWMRADQGLEAVDRPPREPRPWHLSAAVPRWCRHVHVLVHGMVQASRDPKPSWHRVVASPPLQWPPVTPHVPPSWSQPPPSPTPPSPPPPRERQRPLPPPAQQRLHPDRKPQGSDLKLRSPYLPLRDRRRGHHRQNPTRHSAGASRARRQPVHVAHELPIPPSRLHARARAHRSSHSSGCSHSHRPGVSARSGFSARRGRWLPRPWSHPRPQASRRRLGGVSAEAQAQPRRRAQRFRRSPHRLLRPWRSERCTARATAARGRRAAECAHGWLLVRDPRADAC